MKSVLKLVVSVGLLLGVLPFAPLEAGAEENPPIVTPGNILRFDLGPADPPMPQARFGDQWLIVAKERNRWAVLLGVDIATEPGNYLLAVNHSTTDTLHFSVRARRDPVMRRSPAEAPSLEKEALIEAQLQRIQLGMGKKPEGVAKLPLWRPAPVRLVDRFGTRQILPDGGYRPVRHLSFELASDTTVRAPTDGKVVGVADIGRGRLVALDHGQGLVSVLWPLHETKVKAGETLKQGASVGVNLVAGGAKGEVNWALLMNRAWVHPLVLVEETAPAKTPPEAPGKPPAQKDAAPENTPAKKGRKGNL
jgi:hypothetical protein